MPNKNDQKAQDTQLNLSRRNMLKSSAALAATAAVSACGGGGGSSASASNKPNILFIMVDEMRFPKVFPTGVNTPAEYLQKFMPNVYRLWEAGVKFSNHQTAATACSPSRGVIITGLYSHQTWFGTTLVIVPGQTSALSPPLQPEFPTYGKLLREAGYVTPYVGKWHCSQPESGPDELNNYGFQGLTYPDPIANNLQGTYGDTTSDPNYMYWSDDYIGTQAANWLKQKREGDQPWCLTVGFQNPHDYEYFPSGTEYVTYEQNFANVTYNPSNYAQHQAWSQTICATGVTSWPNALVTPPSYGYPATAPNWQTKEVLQNTKPSAQILNRQFCEMEWGGIAETQGILTFSIAAYPNATSYSYTPPTNSNGQLYGIGISPFSYWQKGLDLYTFLQTLVDKQIGKVLDSLTPEVARNTVVVFTSDHGDYAGAHGIVAGKTFTMYDEALRVPLIVKDPRGVFTGDVDTVRPQLTSSVDMMPMLVGLAYGGQRTWMKGDYAEMYGNRYDMFPILKSATVPGRENALFATDETMQSDFDFATPPDVDGQRTPTHILGVITQQYKLGVYSRWPSGTTITSPDGQQYEYYDYATERGRQEVDNTYATTPSAALVKDKLLTVLVPGELAKPLPLAYLPAQKKAQLELIGFIALNKTSGRE
jgi:arylsulfatase A-like enzyme